MEDTENARNFLNETPGGKRNTGRPNSRWVDRVTMDARNLE